jgi:hypothetical protein
MGDAGRGGRALFGYDANYLRPRGLIVTCPGFRKNDQLSAALRIAPDRV